MDYALVGEPAEDGGDGGDGGDDGTTVVCDAASDGQLGFNDRKVFLNLTNIGTDAITIDSIHVSWPSENKKLKKAKLAGREIYAVATEPPSLTIDTGWRGSLTDRTIDAGSTKELLFEFETNAVTDPGRYTVRVQFAGGCEVEYSPLVPPADGGGGCDISAPPAFTFAGVTIAWPISNNGSAPINLGRIYLYWPTWNHSVTRATLDGVEIYRRTVAVPPVLVDPSTWKGTVADWQIGPGQTKTLVFEFETDVATDSHNYNIEADFVEGCSVNIGGDPDDPLEDGFAVLETNVPALVGADLLHEEGILGRGITIAFLDTGFSQVTVPETLYYNADRQWRYMAQYYVRTDKLLDIDTEYFMPPHFTPEGWYRGPSNQDGSGHGSHLTTLALSAKQTPDGKYNGIAPGADLVSITAFDRYGAATYLSIIQGVQFAVENKDRYGIRVLNCSFSAPARSHYWDDPLNQAIMAAWEAGIVVVTSAGNNGPDPMSIGVPGNVPYIITVGAMSDGYTTEDPSDDYLASFSSAGPTVEGFIKPELVAPGGHLRAQMSWVSEIGEGYREYRDAVSLLRDVGHLTGGGRGQWNRRSHTRSRSDAHAGSSEIASTGVSSSGSERRRNDRL